MQDITPEMAEALSRAAEGPKEVQQEKRKVLTITLYDPFSPGTKRTFHIGCGDIDGESGPITDLDTVPGQINLTYEDKRCKTIFYDPTKFELHVIHEPVVESLIAVPKVMVDGNIIG